MSKQANEKNYWLFQANTRRMRLADALRAGALETFTVRQHRQRIQAGDKVILWQTGQASGCYGLATVLTTPAEMEVPETERPFYEEKPADNWRVRLAMEYNLWNKPITEELLPDHPAFEHFNAGLPGVNYRATAEQYDHLLKTVRELDLAMEPEPEYGLPRSLSHPLNLILYGPPGTGKTYRTVDHALAIIEDRPLSELVLEGRSARRRRFEEYQQSGRISFVTFHPSYAYEDFVEGIRPTARDGHLDYRIEDGVFKAICARAREDFGAATATGGDGPKQPEPARRYVLIIDEINRGNIPSIFGELISLLETDKRAGAAEALTSVLPYSKTAFSVPPNLYLVGTMNSTDRSIAQMDMALRRRFAFRELRPRPELLDGREKPMTAGIDLPSILTVINQRIALLLGRDFQVGHAYFLRIRHLDDLKKLFDRQLIPLLQEYFYDDLGKIGLVLGRDFVEEIPSAQEDVFATFPGAGPDDYTRRRNYRLRPLEELDESAFIHIYDETYRHDG